MDQLQRQTISRTLGKSSTSDSHNYSVAYRPASGNAGPALPGLQNINTNIWICIAYMAYPGNSSRFLCFKHLSQFTLVGGISCVENIVNTLTVQNDNKEDKNPAFGRHQLSRPMRIVGPIQIWRGRVIYLIIIILIFLIGCGI